MSTITRRNLAKGVTWATPLVLATTAVPAYSASLVCDDYGLASDVVYGGRYIQNELISTFFTATLYVDIIPEGGSVSSIVMTLPEGFTYDPEQFSSLPFNLLDDGRTVAYNGDPLTVAGDMFEFTGTVATKYVDITAPDFVDEPDIPLPTLTFNTTCSGITTLDYTGSANTRE